MVNVRMYLVMFARFTSWPSVCISKAFRFNQEFGETHRHPCVAISALVASTIYKELSRVLAPQGHTRCIFRVALLRRLYRDRRCTLSLLFHPVTVTYHWHLSHQACDNSECQDCTVTRSGLLICHPIKAVRTVLRGHAECYANNHS